MRVLIVYESLYGSNRRIAQAVAAGIGRDAVTAIVEAKDAPDAIDGDLDLVVVGGPNHKAGPPRPDTRAEAAAESDGTLHPAERGLREWLADLRLVGKPARFCSADGVGALVAGEEERARAWGAVLGGLVRRT